MCNLYTARKSAAEVASHFRVAPPDIASFNAAEDVFPGYSGMVVREAGGRRLLEAMTWGFHRRLKTMKPTSKPLKVNNARDDKLDTPFCKDSFTKRRCLIPVTAWAEAEGEAGKMTKTWYSLPDSELFGVAGIWRPTDEWGDAYSMVMTEACAQMVDVHDRMPIILDPDQWDRWMLGSPAEAKELVMTYDCPLVCDRTDELWSKRRSVAATGSLL